MGGRARIGNLKRVSFPLFLILSQFLLWCVVDPEWHNVTFSQLIKGIGPEIIIINKSDF
jgi:hypothetical protein